MKRALMALGVAVAVSATAYAQDPAKVDSAHYKTIAENDRVRVLKVKLGPNEKTPMHEHPDNFVVFLTDGKVRFKLGDGTTTPDTPARAGEAIVGEAGKHQGENLGGALEAIVVEVKPGGKAAAPVSGAVPPVSGEGVVRTPIISSPHGEVVRLKTQAGFAEPEGSKHEYDAVVVPMTDARATLTMDGKTVPMKKGEAYLIPWGAAHSVTTTGSGESVVVYVKK